MGGKWDPPPTRQPRPLPLLHLLQHLQTRLCSQASKGARQEGGAGSGPEKAQEGTKVWRRRSAHAGPPHGQKSSAWVSSGGPRAKKRRRARRQRARGQLPGAAGPRHCTTYAVRNRWHRASAVHASAASTHRFGATALGDPGGAAGRLWLLTFLTHTHFTSASQSGPPKMRGAQNSRWAECDPNA